jgi:hypothetical protein
MDTKSSRSLIVKEKEKSSSDKKKNTEDSESSKKNKEDLESSKKNKEPVPAVIPPSTVRIEAQKLQFPVHDEQFHHNNISEIEEYTLEYDVNIPIVDSGNGSKYQGCGINIGENYKILRNWFRSGRKGILMWDKNLPIGQELGVYTRQ